MTTGKNTMNDSIPELKIERMDDGIGDGLILLTQDNCGNTDTVALHPLHLRYLAEKCGLVETSDPQAARTIARLERRLRALRDRINHLGDWIANYSDHKHADLSYEVTYIRATMDIADEFCAEMAPSMLEPAPASAEA